MAVLAAFSVRSELIEGLYLFCIEEGQGFDELSPRVF